jgi:L-malate glycosyltransferase
VRLSLSLKQKLKVLHIASGDLWAGAEVQLYTLLSNLKKRDEISLHVALMNDGELSARLREQGITVNVFNETQLNSLQILVKLHGLMLSLKPDIVHTHRIKENILGSVVNLLATRAISVRTVHGAPEHPARGLAQLHKQVLAWLDIYTGRHLQDHIIAVSKNLQAPMAQLFGARKVAVIENGVDIASVQAAVHAVDFRIASTHARHIGIVGRLQPVKRVDLFLETAALLKQIEPETPWQFHVIGDGSLREALEQQAVNLGLAGSVTFHGHRNDSVACLAGLDALIMCSDHEGMPMTALESLAVGTPVLAHAVGGLNDALANGAGGLLVHGHTAQHYADGLLQLLRSDKEELRHKGLERLQDCYSSMHNAEQVANLYRYSIKS